MSDEGDPKGVGRRETLGLATLVAALGAGLAVSFTTSDAEAQSENLLQLKIYRANQKERGLVQTITLTAESSKLLTDAGMAQIKFFSLAKDNPELGESGLVQLKMPAAPAPPVTGSWDVRKNAKS